MPTVDQLDVKQQMHSYISLYKFRLQNYAQKNIVITQSTWFSQTFMFSFASRSLIFHKPFPCSAEILATRG